MPIPLPPKWGRCAIAADRQGRRRLSHGRRTGLALEACDRQTDGRTLLNAPTPSVTGIIINIGVDRDLQRSGAAKFGFVYADKMLRPSLIVILFFRSFY